MTSTLEILEIVELHQEVIGLGVPCADEPRLLCWASENSLWLLVCAENVVVAEVCCERIGLVDLVGLLWRDALAHILLFKRIVTYWLLRNSLRSRLVEEVVSCSRILRLRWDSLEISKVAKTLLVGKLVGGLGLRLLGVLETPILVLVLRLRELIVIESRSRLLGLWLESVLLRGNVTARLPIIKPCLLV